MRLNLDGQPGLVDLVTVPAGTYLCKVAEVRTGTTRHGDERWGIRLVVAEGEYTGRHAAWDGLVFSTRGLPRVKQVLRAFGLPSAGEVDLEPEHLHDRTAFVQIKAEDYVNPDTGEKIRHNGVPYNGFVQPAEAGDERAPDDDGRFGPEAPPGG